MADTNAQLCRRKATTIAGNGAALPRAGAAAALLGWTAPCTENQENSMATSKPNPDPAKAPGLPHEADIGSGEKTPAEHDTDALIRDIPPLPEKAGKTGSDKAAKP
jgi:hypothetical protein